MGYRVGKNEMAVKRRGSAWIEGAAPVQELAWCRLGWVPGRQGLVSRKGSIIFAEWPRKPVWRGTGCRAAGGYVKGRGGGPGAGAG